MTGLLTHRRAPDEPGAGSGTGSGAHGAGLLARAALRRDRVLVAVWLVVLTGLVYASAAATPGLYPDERSRIEAAEALTSSAAVVALYGPITDPTSLGELAMTKLTVLYAVAVAVLGLVLVRRHTRTEEERGLTELLGSTAIGPSAPLAAAVGLAWGVSVVVGVLAAVADVAGGLPLAGSLLFGASWAGMGLVGAGLGAVTCQLSASSRTAAGLASGALGVLYALRVAADVGPAPLAFLGWLSPFGWQTRLQAWSDPRPWVLLLHLGTAVGLVVLAVVLRRRRDLGSGLLAERPGAAEAGASLSGVVGLTWHQHRSALAWWTVAVAGWGMLLGAITPGVGDLLDTDAGRTMLQALGGEGALQDALVSAVLALVGVGIGAWAVVVVARAGADERSGRTEALLSTATARGRLVGVTVVLALAGSAWLLLVAGCGLALGGAVAGATLSGSVWWAGLAYLPAVAVVTGLAVLLWALSPGWAPGGWAVLVGCLLLDLLADLLDLPSGISELSPYAHVAAVPVQTVDPLSSLVLALVAAALLGVAWVRLLTRDIG
ncbi:hypothetical protein [Nocardioides sp. GY 10127]|uniref:ABC transporter permease n=1 Tax=Nocardioides sp. GY 10127 TaxID=2569762 RepID=UPI0010A78B42|nr:hypothetical protein [Nocardioides sp. GY 10127]TIC86534.1 hypothetical protein E8D37_01180 [Nocardioides sp. GY 10127]